MANASIARLYFFLVVTILMICGCATTSTTSINANTNDPGGTIHVFYNSPNGREYTELGVVTTQTGQTIFHDRSVEGMINKLKIEAEKMGADAIIIRSAIEGIWGINGFDRGKAQGITIKFK
jgi:hypothetical protein